MGCESGGAETAEKDGNATLLADTPFHDEMLAKYPKGFLSASGMDVGLPDGQMGNSEVGHLNLGAGRIVYQDLTRVNKAIADGELASNPVFSGMVEKAKGSRLHLIGLVSDGGVHSHQNQLIAMVNLAAEAGVSEIMIHAITDGRDTSPTGGAGYLKTVQEGISGSGAQIATVVGRYFAMDRDKRWDRVKLAWDAIVLGGAESREGLPVMRLRNGMTTTRPMSSCLPWCSEKRIPRGSGTMMSCFSSISVRTEHGRCRKHF